MVVNGSEMIILGKYSESAFQNYLQKFYSPKIMGDINLKKTLTKNSEVGNQSKNY